VRFCTPNYDFLRLRTLTIAPPQPSRFMTLMPGDIIATGTPPGVGMGKKPAAIYLKPGDVMTLGIEGLGAQRQQTREWSPAAGARP
jgi:2,4-diketo-3-deoxy-L-fuconate hydrolase